MLLVTFLPTVQPTGDVSVIQTVGDSSDSSCLTSDASPMNSFFTLDPAIPSECSLLTISWNTTRYQVPPVIRGFIEGGDYFPRIDISNASTSDSLQVAIKEGTQVIFLLQPRASSQRSDDTRTSPLLTVAGKSTSVTDCSISHKSTVILTSSTATPTVATSTLATSTIIASISVLPAANKPTKNV